MLLFLALPASMLIGSVWIVGDSIVRWAAGTLHLPFHVKWQGKSGAHLCDIQPMLASRSEPDPLLIMIHVGTNDLVGVDEFCLRQRVLVLLESASARYPHSLIVWSGILPRVFYFGARSQASMENKRKAVNRWARKQCQKLGACYLHHPQFVWTSHNLYRFDGVHLSPEGVRIFQENIRQCICSLLKFTGAAC